MAPFVGLARAGTTSSRVAAERRDPKMEERAREGRESDDRRGEESAAASFFFFFFSTFDLDLDPDSLSSSLLLLKTKQQR